MLEINKLYTNTTPFGMYLSHLGFNDSWQTLNMNEIILVLKVIEEKIYANKVISMKFLYKNRIYWTHSTVEVFNEYFKEVE